MHRAFTLIKTVGLLISAALALNGCDAGPSAVLPDGEGQSPAPYEARQKPPIWAEKATPEAPQDSANRAEDFEPAQNDPEPRAQEPSQHPAAAKPVPVKTLTGPTHTLSDTHYGSWPLWSSNRKYSALENAHYHFDKHAAEFGIKDYDTYVAFVHGFVHNPPQGTQTLLRNNGDTLFYSPDYNIFAVTTKKGAPRTLFRPDNGAAYWQKQKQTQASRRTLKKDG